MSIVNCKYLKDENGNIISPVTGINSIYGYSEDVDKSYKLIDILDLLGVHEIATYGTYTTYYDIPNMSLYRILIVLYRLHNITNNQSTTLWGSAIIDTIYMNNERIAIGTRWPVGDTVWESTDTFLVDVTNNRLARQSNDYTEDYHPTIKVIYGIYDPFYISKIK